jgi:hypothetical protein
MRLRRREPKRGSRILGAFYFKRRTGRKSLPGLKPAEVSYQRRQRYLVGVREKEGPGMNYNKRTWPRA